MPRAKKQTTSKSADKGARVSKTVKKEPTVAMRKTPPPSSDFFYRNGGVVAYSVGDLAEGLLDAFETGKTLGDLNKAYRSGGEYYVPLEGAAGEQDAPEKSVSGGESGEQDPSAAGAPDPENVPEESNGVADDVTGKGGSDDASAQAESGEGTPSDADPANASEGKDATSPTQALGKVSGDIGASVSVG